MTYKVLMVCTGNICRSPMAEVVLAQSLGGLEGKVQVDSAGISAEEHGNPIDYRAQRILSSGGYEVPDRVAQQITVQDIVDYDLILAMTRTHYNAISRLAQQVPEEERAEIRMYRDFATDADQRSQPELDVPDPWYGTIDDFVETLETLEDATPQLVGFISEQTA